MLKPITKRDGTGLGKSVIAVQSKDGNPYMLWNLYRNGTKHLLAVCDDVLRLPTNWKVIDEIVIDAIDFSLVFDGEWIYRDGRWKLQTEDTPYIFWVTSSGVLNAQKYGDSYIQEIATGVTSTSTLRAWKNTVFPERDQGMVVSYVKNNILYYRAYCIQADGVSVTWEPEREVVYLSGFAKRASLFLLNDYRIGFSIEDTSGNIHWLITERNWAGMAIGQEHIGVTASAQVDFIPVTYHNTYEDEHVTVAASAAASMLFGRTDNSIITLMNEPTQRLDGDSEPYDDWGFKIGMTVNFPTETPPVVTVKDATTLSAFTLATTTMISDTEFELIIDDAVHEFGINDVEGNLQVTITGMTNEAGYDYDTVVQEFTPINLVPPEIPLPEVEVIWNE